MVEANDLIRVGAPKPPQPLPFVCGGCGCWCDDIDNDADDKDSDASDNDVGEQPTFRAACSLGQDYFTRLTTRSIPAELPDDDLLSELAHLLRTARRPLLTGLHHSVLETQRLAVAIADRCNGVIDPFLPDAAQAKTLAFQQSGDISASWGEVKNRADVIIYWRCRPDRAPRFRERYGDLSSGEFIQATERTVIVVDSKPDPAIWISGEATSASSSAIQFVSIGDDDRITLEQLIAAGKTRPATGSLAEHDHGIGTTPLGEATPSWWPIVQALSQAKYAAIVVGELRTNANAHAPQALMPLYQLLQRWTASWNDQQRCVAVPFAGSANRCRTAQSVLTWRTGYPMSVDFSLGFPRYDSAAFHWRELMARDEVDLILLFSGESDLSSSPSPWTDDHHRLAKWAEKNPLWEIGTQPTIPTAHRFLSTLTSEAVGASLPRTIGRPDGVLLPFPVFPAATINTEPELTERLWKLLHHAPIATP